MPDGSLRTEPLRPVWRFPGIMPSMHRSESRPIAWLVAALAAGLSGGVAAAVPPADEAADLFEKQVRPLLVERCQACHGGTKQWAGLRLDSRDAILTGGDSGPALVPGQPDRSEIVARIVSTDADVRMPPPEHGPAVTAAQAAAVRAWIAAGAPWPAAATAAVRPDLRRTHWAYQPIVAPEPPKLDDRAWPRGPIDRFILASLEAAGLEPATEADRATFIRRATFDLHGLPPTSDEIAAFVADSSPDAHDRLVDRLLASPRYGEHWGRHWLDVARYSESKGYVDSGEGRWHVHAPGYRDWVIRAFNDDMPYDRFILLQMAADQVARDEPAHLAALGFLTLGRRFLGNAPDIIDDRIDVVTRGLLGLTVGCARCHDHKYDPIPARDYYSLYGVFHSTVERLVPLPRPASAPIDVEFEKGLAERVREYEKLEAGKRREANERLRKRFPDYLLAQRELAKYPEQEFVQLSGPEELLPGLVRRFEVFLRHADRRGDPVFAPWIALGMLADADYASRAAAITAELQRRQPPLNPLVAAAFREPPASAAEVARRYADLLAASDARWTDAVSAARRDDRPEPTALDDAAAEEVRQAFSGVDSPCVIPVEPLVQTNFLWDFKTREALWTAQAKIDDWLWKRPEMLPHAVVLDDRPTVRDALLLRGGNAAAKGDIVPRRFLEVLAGPDRRPFTEGSGRRELAAAIVAVDNPLTARVWVNRVWLHHFGAGLVLSPSDFGVRAAPPSHPQLLDWLATRLHGAGYRTKALHREIMLSATYRQSSRPAPASLARAMKVDPDNRLLWRMNPRRLSFEQFRDALLAVSGQLDTTGAGKGTDLFGTRRTIYTENDRHVLPGVLGVFDFANPNLHTPQRGETTTALQALFGMNHPFVAERARQVAKRAGGSAGSAAGGDPLPEVYRAILGRAPSAAERAAGAEFLAAAAAEPGADLAPLEQLAQVLLLSNEFMFVD